MDRLPELEELIAVARAALTAGAAGHRAAVLHADVAGVEGAADLVLGYRDGTLSSRDPEATAAGVPFRPRVGELDQRMLATLRAYMRHGLPLYLLRVHFEQSRSAWSVANISLQSMDQRSLMLRQRAEPERALVATLVQAAGASARKIVLSWDNQYKARLPLRISARTEQRVDEVVPMSGQVEKAVEQMNDFYRAHRFDLDAFRLVVERANRTPTTNIDDYYG